jgi:hypothetical protein
VVKGWKRETEAKISWQCHCYLIKNMCIPMFIVALYMISKVWETYMPISRLVKKIWYTYIMECCLALKRRKFICKNIDESRGHYAKWNKPDREGQILHDLTYMWNLKMLNSQKYGVELWLPDVMQVDGWGKGRCYSKHTKFHLDSKHKFQWFTAQQGKYI